MIEATSTLPTCPACTIELDSMFTIGNPLDTVFPSDGLTSIVEGADHRFYVAPLSVEQKIGQYDRHGRLLAMFGGHGEAPGKYYAPAAIAASPDSMLLVLDINQVIWYRLDSLTAEHGPLGDFPNQGGLLAFRHRRFVTTSSGGMPGSLMYSDPKPDGRQVGVSASPTHTQLETPAQLRMFRSITGTDSNWLTMSKWFEPVVEVWRDFGLVQRVRLPAEWFEPYDTNALTTSLAGPNARAVPMSRSLWIDPRGLLWTITSVEDSARSSDGNVADQTQTEAELHQHAAESEVSPRHERYDAVIAVYQLTDGSISLITSRRFDPSLESILSDSVLAGTSRTEPGMTRFTLFRYVLRGFTP